MTYTQSPTLTRWQPWTARDETWFDKDLTGYTVEALDGQIGKVDRSMHQMDNGYLVVGTGGWISGEKVMLPAGIISGVDHNNRQVIVERTKEQIKKAPKFNDTLINDPTYRATLGTYYGQGEGWYQPSR